MSSSHEIKMNPAQKMEKISLVVEKSIDGIVWGRVNYDDNLMVDSAENLLPELHKALSMSLSGRQGPVLLDIPNDVQRAEIPDTLVEKWLKMPLEINDGHDVSASELQKLESLCASAQRPLICPTWQPPAI